MMVWSLKFITLVLPLTIYVAHLCDCTFFSRSFHQRKQITESKEYELRKYSKYSLFKIKELCTLERFDPY